MTNDPKIADTRQQILAEHQAIAELSGRIAELGDAEQLAAALRQLLPLLQRHFQAEEHEIDGLHASIRRRTPEQQHALLSLKDEHRQLLDRVQLLLAIAQETRGGGPKLQLLGRQLQERLAAHEAKETGLFVDSIWTDIGEGD